MTELNLPLPSIGQPNSTEDPDILACFQAIQGLLNGGLSGTNFTGGAGLTADMLAAALAVKLGVQAGGRGSSTANAEVSTTSTNWVTLAGDSPVVVTQADPGMTYVAIAADARKDVGGTAEIAIQINGTGAYAVPNTNYTTNNFYTHVPAGVGTPNDLMLMPFNLPGTHSFNLAYRSSNSASAWFINRWLRVWTVGF